MLRIETIDDGPTTTIRLMGEVDEEAVTSLRRTLVECVRRERYHVIVNMAEVRFISYMGIGILVERLRQIRACEGDMKLVGLNLHAQRLFRMVGVTKLFEVYESEAQAMEVYKEAA